VAAYAVDVWTALGDPTRRAIFERLAESPKAVGDLARAIPVSQPAVSQHLRVLKDAGLVEDRPVGSQRIYRLNRAGLAAHRAQLDRFWTKALAAYKAVAEPPKKTKTRRLDDTSKARDRRPAAGSRRGANRPGLQDFHRKVRPDQTP
jgi:DNA-binding transcriptional ArsR family regulator